MSVRCAFTRVSSLPTFNSMFDWIANIHWLCVIRSHQCDQTVRQIGNILKRSGLLPIPIDLSRNADT